MKKNYLLTIIGFFICNLLVAQQLPDKIIFDYDTAGNQIFRGIVIEMQDTSIQSINSIEGESETQQSFGYEETKLRYYPNPVKTQLQVEWNKTFKAVDYMMLHTSSFQKLAEIRNLSQDEHTSITFDHLPTGSYYLSVYYMDGTKETVTILKR